MKSDHRNLRLLALLAACVIAPASHGEDLAGVYALSKAGDPRYKASRHELEASGYAKDEAFAALLPTASFERTNTDTRQEILSSKNTVYAAGASSYPTTSETFTLTQPVFKAAAWLGNKQAESKVRQAAAIFAAAGQDLIVRAATAYLNVLAGKDALTFAEAERDAVKHHLDLAEARYVNGLGSISALHDAKSRYAVKEADVVGARNELDDMVQALREVTGKLTPELAPLHGEIPLNLPEPNDLNQWIEMAQKNNPVLEARRQAVNVARQEVEKQRAGHYPVLDVVATSNRKDTGGSLFGGGSDVRTNELMVRFNLPIYTGGLTSALTAESASRYQGAQEDMVRDERQVERQARASFQGVIGGVGRVNAFAQSVKSQESARQLKFEGFKAGLETMLAVLDAERDLYAAKRDFAKARYDFILNGLRLKQAAGTLSEADLLAVNEMIRVAGGRAAQEPSMAEARGR